MTVPSVMVYRLEGCAAGLDGPCLRGSQCAEGDKDGQPRKAFPAMDGNTPGVHRIADVSTNDVLLFSDIGLSLVHHYRVHKRGLPHVAFRRNYMSQLRALLPLPAVLPIKGGSPDPACSSLPCAVESSDVVCASPQPSNSGHGVTRVNRSSTHGAGPTGRGGAVVLDCRPPLLPGMMNVTVVDLAEIQSSTVASEADTVPPEREQSFGGGDLPSLICPELGVALRIDPGTDLEDELSDLADSPAGC